MRRPITKFSLMTALALSMVACSHDETVIKEVNTITNKKQISMSFSQSPLIKRYQEYKSKNVEVLNEHVEKSKEVSRPYIDEVDSVLSKSTLDYIWNRCKENDFSYELILAIIKHESKLGRDKINYNADGSVDKGIMHINSRNIESLSKLAHIKNPNPMNDKQSIDMAFELLKYERNFWKEKDKYSEEQIYFLNLLSYNIGSPRVPKFLHRYGWNSDYVDLITKYKNEFEMMEVAS